MIQAKTVAPNKIQFNGVGRLRTYVSYALTGDHGRVEQRIRETIRCMLKEKCPY
jgi:hypothetical protein